jgi:hypothetical protein
MWRQTQIHANFSEERPIAVLSLFKGLRFRVAQKSRVFGFLFSPSRTEPGGPMRPRALASAARLGSAEPPYGTQALHHPQYSGAF